MTDSVKVEYNPNLISKHEIKIDWKKRYKYGSPRVQVWQPEDNTKISAS
ncbi:hypothetical protein [Nitrososphaera sp. AFS]|nr:hypothetical protein [Nitrososphaera sp. AFS]